MSVLKHSTLSLRRTMPRIGRLALMLALACALVGATLSDAEAGPRRRAGVVIGVGILGALILNEAARSENTYQQRSYRQAEPRRSYRSTRKEQRYSEPVEKKKKVRTASKSRSKSKSAQPAEEVAVAQPQPAEQEADLPATEGTAATASPPQDNSYLPETDRKKAGTRGTAAKPGDLPPVANAAPTQALPEAAGTSAPDTISTLDEIKSAQEHLKYMGYDIPAATGTLDAPTKAAFTAFQRSIGAQPTGMLTYDQLQTLFVKAADLANGKTTKQR
jgi:hypothetical protein